MAAIHVFFRMFGFGLRRILRASQPCVLLLVVGVAIPATVEAVSPQLQQVRFSEVYRDKVPVVGGRLRGLLWTHGSATISPERLTVVLPRGPAMHLCLVAESQDGRYYAELEYRVPAQSGEQRVTLRFPTKHEDIVKKYLPRDLGITAKLAENCADTEGTYLPVAWGYVSSEGYFVFLVASGGPNVDVQMFDRERRVYVACKRDRKSKNLTAFDNECEFRRGAQRRVGEWVIVRERGGKPLEDFAFKVYLP